MTPQTECIRCGTCCMKGGPALHQEDAVLFKKGVLSRRRVYTLRKGEAVRNFDETVMELEGEIIKVRGRKNSWTCSFFDGIEQGCAIYTDRPLECRALRCWDHRNLQTAMKKPYLQREHLIDKNDGIIKLIAAHEQRCGYDALKSAVREVEGPNPEQGVEKVLDLLEYDDFMRPFLIEKLQLDPASMDFLFGRPLTTTIHMFGLQVKTEGKNRILVPLEKKE